MSGPVATPAAGASTHGMSGVREPRLSAMMARPTYACVSARRIAAFPACLLSTPPLICIIIALLAGCGTTALKPEPKLVSSVTSLPPVQVPVPVRCVKEVPPIPPVTIDPNAPVLARYYQMKADLLALDDYKIKANAALLACAEPKP